jgi:two-component system cell cycle response regulator DivK
VLRFVGTNNDGKSTTSVPAAVERSTAMKNSGKVVLVTEDNAANLKLFHDLLKARGFNVLQAKDGMQGWELAREHRPDLILMDIQLPDISGMEVTRWLKNDEDLKSIPVIAITAFAMESDEKNFLEIGCDAYISKPISIPHFLQTVEHFVAEQEPSPAEREVEAGQFSVRDCV